MQNPQAVGRALREARLDARLTQAQLGARLGVGEQAGLRWETARCLPRRRMRARLVEELARLSPKAGEAMRSAVRSLDPAPVQPVAAPVPARPAPPSGEVALELGLLALAEELDVSPRKLREALRGFLGRVGQAGFSLGSAYQALAAKPVAEPAEAVPLPLASARGD
jgi:transcriptional regulator with XRE-family HTH domain